MAARSYEAGFKRCYGDRLANLSHETTENEIQQIYDNWAEEYEKAKSKNCIRRIRCLDLWGLNARRTHRSISVDRDGQDDKSRWSCVFQHPRWPTGGLSREDIGIGVNGIVEIYL